MADHTVQATFTAVTYQLDGAANNPPQHTVKHGDTLSWMSQTGAILVTLPEALITDQSPTTTFAAPQGQYTQRVKLKGQKHDVKGTVYSYSVTVNGLTDDPQIIFDDTGLRPFDEEKRRDI